MAEEEDAEFASFMAEIDTMPIKKKKEESGVREEDAKEDEDMQAFMNEINAMPLKEKKKSDSVKRPRVVSSVVAAAAAPVIMTSRKRSVHEATASTEDHVASSNTNGHPRPQKRYRETTPAYDYRTTTTSAETSAASTSSHVPVPPRPPTCPPPLPSLSSQTDLKDKSSSNEPQKRKTYYRAAAGHVWEDKSLAEWPEGDFRIFVGNLGNEVTTDMLAEKFCDLKSFAMAKVMRDKRTKKSRGFGFVSFLHPNDMVTALKDRNGKYCGNRPMKLTKSTWNKLNVGSRKGRKMRRKKHLSLF